MSYCRFSCNDWESDVYVYQGESGLYFIHVAGLRYDVPPGAPGFDRANPAMTPIGGHFDGTTIEEGTAAAAAATLRGLVKAGYRVPQHALDSLDAEAQEAGT